MTTATLMVRGRELPKPWMERLGAAPDTEVKVTLTTSDQQVEELQSDIEDFNLSDWQTKGVEDAERSLAAGRTMAHEKVCEWLESWGKDIELPMPQLLIHSFSQPTNLDSHDT